MGYDQHHRREYQRRIDAKIASAKGALMSNHKWLKLFQLLLDYPDRLGRFTWKFIGSDQTYRSPIGTLMEDRFGDCMPAPCTPYREIDSILIPKTFPDPKSDPKRALPDCENDLKKLKNYLDQHGNFPVEIVEEGLIIRGYLWGDDGD